MIFHTTAQWDEPLWLEAERVYRQAFPEPGSKTRTIIRRMFERNLCRLHTAAENGQVVAMALTGGVRDADVLIIDYLAVDREERGHGIGRMLLDYIEAWAETTEGCRGVVIEVEAEPTSENKGRIRFWERCGYRLTEYVHHYIWVPEPYSAMYKNFDRNRPLPDEGELLFRYITKFHNKAYRGKD
ncbi:GNAT family N-acetyltransferase [Paenibacillus sp. MBLB4367]|uniref:GNAT family N-acetyltransferase n=1 Tax=Paenibacillus sp. MBLB4367 TaxID=3384767 RepID=UPI003908342E